MFCDKDTNVVYLSEALQRYWEVFAQLRGILTDNGIKYKLIRGTRNIWTRDWMPLQVSQNHFVEFMYGADIEKYPQLKLPWNTCKLPFMKHLTVSGIYLDGGNCVRYKDRVIMTDIIFRRNPGAKKKALLANIESLLEAQIILVPHESYDPMGHADGVAKWIDEKTVFVEEFTDKRYLERLLAVLAKHNLGVVLFPLAYNQCPKMSAREFRKRYPDADTNNPGVGFYVNMLHVDNLIVVPAFGFGKDQEAVDLVKKYFPESVVESVECFDLAMEGGLVHCVTQNYQVAA